MHTYIGNEICFDWCLQYILSLKHFQSNKEGDELITHMYIHCTNVHASLVKQTSFPVINFLSTYTVYLVYLY